MDKFLKKERRERRSSAGKNVEESIMKKREKMGKQGAVERQKEKLFKRIINVKWNNFFKLSAQITFIIESVQKMVTEYIQCYNSIIEYAVDLDHILTPPSILNTA